MKVTQFVRNGLYLVHRALKPHSHTTAGEDRTTRMGFEPTRAEHNGLAVHRLNHSATSSSYFRYLARFISKFILGNSLFQRERRLGDGLETSGRRGDGPFSHEWTKNWIGKPATGEKKKKNQHICVGLHSFSPAAGRGHLSIKSEFAVTVSRPGSLVQRPQGAAEKTAGNSGSQNQSSWSRCQGSWRRWTPNAGLIK